MRKLFVLPASMLLLFASLSMAAEIVTLKAFNGTKESEALTLKAGESAKLLFVTYTGYDELNPCNISVTFDEAPDSTKNVPLWDTDYTRFACSGPATIKYVKNNIYMHQFAVFEVKRLDQGASVPVASVVIPQDPEGQFQVVLESSTDAITWTLAQPGTYGGSTEKRFFRTRIVRLNEL